MTKYGVEADYWRLEMITLNYSKQVCEVGFSLHLYFSKDAAEFVDCIPIADLRGGQNPDALKIFIEDADTRTIRKVCYEYVKANVPFFADAEDDADEANASTLPA